MSEKRMSVREMKLLLEIMPDESLLVYNGGVNENTLQQVLRIEVPRIFGSNFRS
jgi:hypothetical protein